MPGRFGPTVLLAALAGLEFLLHVAIHHRYGYDRDELYSIACAKRLAGVTSIKRQACGFRNRERFRNAIYFHLGGLDLYPETLKSTHSKA